MALTQTLLKTRSQEKCYFVVKCRNFAVLQKCYETSKWACRDRVTPPHPRCILSSRLEKRPVVLIFSINNCHGWHGYCEMISFPMSGDHGSAHEEIYECALHNSKSDTSVEMSNNFTVAGTKSDSKVKKSDGSADKNNKSYISADMIDRNGSCSDTQSNSEITVIDGGVDDSISGCDSRSKTSLIVKTGNGDCLETDTSGIPKLETKAIEIPIAQQADSEWYYFSIQWKTIYLKEFGQQCLPFSRTEGFLVTSDFKVNQARNWQELPREIGQRMCQLIDEYYSELERKSQVKLEALAAKQPTPYLTSDINESNQSDWQNIVAKVEAELGQVHLACPFGSQRYNLHHPDSDVDVFIVYQARTKDVLGLNPPKQTIKNSSSEGCDYTILELHRYCELLAGGDPRCVETLFLHQSTVVQCSSQWRKLTEKSLLFLTRQCLDKYLRDALGSNGVKQLLRWKQENQNREELPAKIYKLVYVIIRLLQNARDITEGRPLKVYRELNTQEYETLMSVRQGQKTYDDMWLIIKSLIDAVEQGKDSVVMDTTEAKTTAENWLLQQRHCDFSLYSTTTNS